jgi:hypothetical protein
MIILMAKQHQMIVALFREFSQGFDVDYIGVALLNHCD